MKTCSECHGEFQDTVNKCPKDEIALDSTHVNPLIGSCLAERYQIISMLGSGGTGAVYRAHHLKMDRPIAVKMMHAHMVAKPEALKSFYKEAKTVAQLKHHNIVTLYDFGISPSNQPFLVMDFIEGPNLKKYVETNGPMSLEQLRPILTQIVDGLAYAHSEGIIHQDLKPENIMLAGDKVTLVDFGLAALYSPDKDMAISGNKKKKFIGSPYYMSPEQCLSNSTVDARSDIYSLAIVLYEALCNQLPFERKSAMAMMDSHVRETPNPFKNSNSDLFGLQVCTELTRVFNQAMAKEADNRYPNIQEFGFELDEALSRDAVKLKAIRHRNVAAEQVLVHANQTMQSQKSPTMNNLIALTSTEGKLQLDSGTQFLFQQADIEEALLNPETLETAVNENLPKDKKVIGLLKKMSGICPETVDSSSSGVKQLVECPNCKTPLKPGVLFCLNCQRKLAPPARPTKLSETRNGNSFTYHKMDRLDIEQQIEAKNKLQNLRQQKVVVLSKIQRILNYALAAAIVIGGIIAMQHYFLVNRPWNSINKSISTHKNLEYTQSGRIRR